MRLVRLMNWPRQPARKWQSRNPNGGLPGSEPALLIAALGLLSTSLSDACFWMAFHLFISWIITLGLSRDLIESVITAIITVMHEDFFSSSCYLNKYFLKALKTIGWPSSCPGRFLIEEIRGWSKERSLCSDPKLCSAFPQLSSSPFLALFLYIALIL